MDITVADMEVLIPIITARPHGAQAMDTMPAITAEVMTLITEPEPQAPSREVLPEEVDNLR